MLKSTVVGSVCYERQVLLSKCKMNLLTKQGTDSETHRHRKQTWLPREKGWRDELEVWD